MQFSIIARQIIAALGGMLGHHGLTVDENSTVSILAALIFLTASSVWSVMSKAEASDSTKEAVKKIAGAVASQCVAALAGWLQADAGTVENPTALMVFAANATLSHVRGHVPTGVKGQWNVILFAACMLSLTSCEFLKSPGVRNVALTFAEGALIVADMELDLALRDWINSSASGDSVAVQIAKGLAVSAKEAALKEAQKAVAAERAKLAKQPLNVLPAK